MAITDHQARYFAHELTRRFPPNDAGRIASALVDAQVDLNPHQVDAALFAFRSPLSKGVLLADEVGLGKTIEAGLVISQRWAERRRNILIITPANLRKQWYQELTEKFSLPCSILEARSFNMARKQGIQNPFDAKSIAICSYQFARSKEMEVAVMPWDLVVIDEAHRLRNVYKTSNVIANALKRALSQRQKLLLTATPLQNSLLELYGLVSFIDEHVFGDVRTFREQYTVLDNDVAFQSLKRRIAPVCHRTLRRQVSSYISYTKRTAILESFTPDQAEDEVYELVSEYLRRDNLQALPSGQRSLLTLVLRKLLASSTFAIAGALTTMADRLRAKLRKGTPPPDVEEALESDYESLDETADEWGDDDEPEILTPESREALQREIGDLDEFAALAARIKHNAKGKALLIALEKAFHATKALGASEKAIIFTESRRTQQYLLRVLHDGGFTDKDIVLFNGTNTDESSRAIYAAWIQRHRGTDRVTGSRTADMRSALVEYFRDSARIMIATEAAAEGINLQFCSLVVNYDLPWNPQRIEQRIGRCHRYGQKHDVVVVNFLNKSNAADVRVFQLLSEKFKLFDGVFGVSDEVLGAVEAGVDFEKRIAGIYQACRHPTEIRQAFDTLQFELKFEIDEAMTNTRRKLLENFDDDVRERLRVTNEESEKARSRLEMLLMALTRHELGDRAEFTEEGDFQLHRPPAANHPTGWYALPRRDEESHLYRIGHPLAEWVVDQAKSRVLEPVELEFTYSAREGRSVILEPLIGKSGWMSVYRYSVTSLDRVEDHTIIAAVADDGTVIDPSAPARLLRLPACDTGAASLPSDVAETLEAMRRRSEADIQLSMSAENAKFLDAEADKLESWADDQKNGLERELKDIERLIREIKRSANGALNLERKLAIQKEVKAAEATRSEKRKRLFDAQDEVDRQRQVLIEQVEARLEQSASAERLLTVRWSLTTGP